jgi:DNA-binding CsgD family transcriptional regulator
LSGFFLRIDSENEQSTSSADINLLSVGFGLLQGWIFLAVFSAEHLSKSAQTLSDNQFFANQFGALSSFGVCIFSCLTLLLIGATNQKYLKHYVKRHFVYGCAAAGFIGTLLLFFTSYVGFESIYSRILSDLLIGLGIGSLIALWGIAFSRFEFNTILINTTLGAVIGLVIYIVFSNTIAFTVLSAITAFLPLLSAVVLIQFTPKPFYLENRIPIFQPLQKRKGLFVLRLGLPLFLLGVSQGALRYSFITGVLKADDFTFDLLCGAACTAALVLFVGFITLYKRSHNSTALFRLMIPFVAVSFLCMPQMFGEFSFAGCFFMMLGYIVLLVISWTMITDTSQTFRLSPLFVVGILYGLLTLGAAGGTMAASIVMTDASNIQLEASTLSLAMLTIVVFASSMIPNQFEMRKVICPAQAAIEKQISKDIEDEDESQALVHEAELYLESMVQENKAKKTAIMQAKTAEVKSEILGEPNAEPAQTATPAKPEPQDQVESELQHPTETQHKGRFALRCEELADNYMLSRRETEVLFLLAKGHNAEFIQNKLCVSRSTAKTHINHIYRKMDIHTQQELLNMVDNRKESESTAVNKPVTGLKPPISASKSGEFAEKNGNTKPSSQNKNIRKNIFAE